MSVKPENYLAAAEMSEEQNYNQIDGIPNNTPPKQSLLDTLRQCREESEKLPGADTPPSHVPVR